MTAKQKADTEPQPQVGTIEGVTEATIEQAVSADYKPKTFVRGKVEREATSLGREYALKFDGFVEKKK